MRKPKPVPGSLAWEAQQLVRAVSAAHQKPEIREDPPLCPTCNKRERVYDSKGRLLAYCLECKHAIDKARYLKVKKNK